MSAWLSMRSDDAWAARSATVSPHQRARHRRSVRRRPQSAPAYRVARGGGKASVESTRGGVPLGAARWPSVAQLFTRQWSSRMSLRTAAPPQCALALRYNGASGSGPCHACHCGAARRASSPTDGAGHPVARGARMFPDRIDARCGEVAVEGRCRFFLTANNLSIPSQAFFSGPPQGALPDSLAQLSNCRRRRHIAEQSRSPRQADRQ